MNWYKVLKTIKGRRYWYWQKTKRFGKKVKTYNIYIGPESAITTGRTGQTYIMRKNEIEILMSSPTWTCSNCGKIALYGPYGEKECGECAINQEIYELQEGHRPTPKKPSFLSFCVNCEEANDDLDWEGKCHSCANY